MTLILFACNLLAGFIFYWNYGWQSMILAAIAIGINILTVVYLLWTSRHPFVKTTFFILFIFDLVVISILTCLGNFQFLYWIYFVSFIAFWIIFSYTCDDEDIVGLYIRISLVIVAILSIVFTYATRFELVQEKSQLFTNLTTDLLFPSIIAFNIADFILHLKLYAARDLIDGNEHQENEISHLQNSDSCAIEDENKKQADSILKSNVLSDSPVAITKFVKISGKITQIKLIFPDKDHEFGTIELKYRNKKKRIWINLNKKNFQIALQAYKNDLTIEIVLRSSYKEDISSRICDSLYILQ